MYILANCCLNRLNNIVMSIYFIIVNQFIFLFAIAASYMYSFPGNGFSCEISGGNNREHFINIIFIQGLVQTRGINTSV